MMNINFYESIKVELLRSTPHPMEILSMALTMTMKKDFNKDIPPNILKYIVKMNHTSVLEHINYTFFIHKASRSFLAQITRHRIASYTSGSQHYQTYSDYEITGSSKMGETQKKKYLDSCERAMKDYNDLIAMGVPKYEARQLLPNAMENNLMITINARSLINLLNLRLCHRNTDEIQIIAEKMLALVKNHLPELWAHIGTDCFTDKCKQGKMSCGVVWGK